jgi:hypothetical protein
VSGRSRARGGDLRGRDRRSSPRGRNLSRAGSLTGCQLLPRPLGSPDVQREIDSLRYRPELLEARVLDPALSESWTRGSGSPRPPVASWRSCPPHLLPSGRRDTSRKYSNIRRAREVLEAQIPPLVIEVECSLAPISRPRGQRTRRCLPLLWPLRLSSVPSAPLY